MQNRGLELLAHCCVSAKMLRKLTRPSADASQQFMQQGDQFHLAGDAGFAGDPLEVGARGFMGNVQRYRNLLEVLALRQKGCQLCFLG